MQRAFSSLLKYQKNCVHDPMPERGFLKIVEGPKGFALIHFLTWAIKLNLGLRGVSSFSQKEIKSRTNHKQTKKVQNYTKHHFHHQHSLFLMLSSHLNAPSPRTFGLNFEYDKGCEKPSRLAITDLTPTHLNFLDLEPGMSGLGCMTLSLRQAAGNEGTTSSEDSCIEVASSSRHANSELLTCQHG